MFVKKRKQCKSVKVNELICFWFFVWLVFGASQDWILPSHDPFQTFFWSHDNLRKILEILLHGWWLAAISSFGFISQALKQIFFTLLSRCPMWRKSGRTYVRHRKIRKTVCAANDIKKLSKQKKYFLKVLTTFYKEISENYLSRQLHVQS